MYQLVHAIRVEFLKMQFLVYLFTIFVTPPMVWWQKGASANPTLGGSKVQLGDEHIHTNVLFLEAFNSEWIQETLTQSQQTAEK